MLRRGVLGVGLAALAAITVAGAMALPATAAVADAPAAPDIPGLTIVDGMAKRTVELKPCQEDEKAPTTDVVAAISSGFCPKAKDPEADNPLWYMTGVLVLTVISDAKTNGVLRLSYVPSDGDPSFSPPGEGDGVVLVGADVASNADRVMIARGERHTLRLRFALASDAPMSALDGSLALRARTTTEVEGKRPTVSVGHATMPVAAKAAALDKIVLQPPKLEMSVTSWIKDSWGDGDTAEVDLVGPGVRDLVARATGAAPSVLMRDGSSSVVATLDIDDSASEDDPERVHATVELSKSPNAGDYSGDLPVSELAPGGLKLPVVVKSHWHGAIALLALFLGVFVGVILRQLFLMAQRRRLMEVALQEALEAYDEARTSLLEGPLHCNPLWNLEDMVEPRPTNGGDPQSLKGLRGIFTSIRNARSTVDLDEDAARVLDAVARMQRWLRLAPAALRLEMVARELPAASVPSLAWDSTCAYRDARLLLEAVQHEPANAKEADDLVERLLRQAEWSHGFLRVWEVAANAKRYKLVKDLNSVAAAAAVSDGKPPPTALDRDADSQVTLDAELHRAARRLGIAPEALDPPELPSDYWQGTRVIWSATPNSFTGWATLDGKSYGQLVDQSRATARIDGVKKAMRRPSALEWVASLAVVAVACAIYMPTVYNETWGGWTAFATAVLAGLAGNVAIDWVALPIFQSRRLRAAAAEAAEAQPAEA